MFKTVARFQSSLMQKENCFYKFTLACDHIYRRQEKCSVWAATAKTLNDPGTITTPELSQAEDEKV